MIQEIETLIAQSSLGAAMRETANWPVDLPVSLTRPSTPLGPVCKWCWGEAERRATRPGMGAALAVYMTLIGEPQTPWCRAGEAATQTPDAAQGPGGWNPPRPA